jgi:hypothetical protein
MKPTAPWQNDFSVLPRYPAVAYLSLVRRLNMNCMTDWYAVVLAEVILIGTVLVALAKELEGYWSRSKREVSRGSESRTHFGVAFGFSSAITH